MTARLGSLCTGAGMLDAAIGELLPLRHTWHTETDTAASAVLDHHWPGVPNLGDITAVEWDTVDSVDILVGGIPCQGWSGSGRRRGSDDDRDLWPVRRHEPDGTARRGALDAIRALRPALFVLENVDRLVNAEAGRPFATILADLVGLGYSVSWTVRGACRHGACHCRHRLFLAATLFPVDRPDGSLFGLPLGSVRRWPAAGFVSGGQMWEIPAVRCGRRGLPLLPTPTARDAGRGAGWGDEPGRPLSEVVCHYRDFAGTRFEAAVRRHEAVSGRPSPPAVTAEPNRMGNPQQSAEFPEWMQDWPPGWASAVVDREAALRLVGNGVNPRQALSALPLLPTFRAAVTVLRVADEVQP